MSSLAANLIDPIREGTFPDSATVLSTDLDFDAIAGLLESIATARDELSAELREVSRPYAGGVDEWIKQAKRVQQDIAQCKQDAQQIVQEHDRLEQQRKDSSDAESTSISLSVEIDYSNELQTQLHSISNVWQQLQAIEDSLAADDIVSAAKAVTDVTRHVSNLRGPGVQALFSEYRDDIVSKTKAKLENSLISRVTVRYDATEALLSIQDSEHGDSTNEALTQALVGLESAQSTLDAMSERIDAFVLRTLYAKTSRNLKSHMSQQGGFTITFGDTPPALSQILRFTRDIALFLHSSLPAQMYAHVAALLGPRLVSGVITDWLTPAIPLELDQVHMLDSLSAEVAALADFLDAHDWPNAGDLRKWTQLAPRMWISKRKSGALEAVRKAFARSNGTLHQVERVERQKASALDTAQPTATSVDEPTDEWNTSWDDDQKSDSGPKPGNSGEDDTSGWGFDDDMEDDHPKPVVPNGSTGNEEKAEDVDDAWGWGDEDAETKPASKVNGDQKDATAASQELVMTELYSVTDIPDYIIESIGKDIQDALILQQESHASLNGVPASSGLLALPSLALAMFRATAPTCYLKTSELGNMNLYNDALYLADKLRHMPAPTGMNDMERDCLAMEKFARAAYAREMDTQRTILSDLLDGVQGFTIQYADQIEDAIAAASDRLRQVHAEWSPILSTSALLQSTGALLSSMLGKVITDVEEMDDISEAQSQRLSNFCGQLAKLEDLFISRPSGDSQADQEPVLMVALYCSNWLRFQYLVNILESNLRDIQYLWTEGELSLEFSQDEVVDLIKALFAESSHRRSAIAAIR